MDAARVRVELAAVDALPYGPERTARREDLVAHAEQCGDPALLASALLSHADDCQEDGENQPMVVSFGRAWRIWQTRPESFDASLRFRFREHFQHVVDVLNEDSRVPDVEVDRLMAEMEGFYRAGGYSLRAVHRSRYWIYRRRGENDLATRQIEALLAEPGDSGASCDACDLATAAYWYEKQDDLPRAVELWLTVIGGVRSCERPHVGIAHGEVMIDLLNLERFDEARRHHLLGYPAIRRRRDLPRQLELHALFVNRTRDVLRGLELLHDHVDWLPADRDAVGDLWWVHGRFLLFLKLLINEGHGDLPITVGGGRVVPVSRLYTLLDTVLADHAAHQDRETGGTELVETLETWRTAKLRHDVLPPVADDELRDASAPIPAPWADLAPRPLPPGIEPVDALAARARYLSFLEHPHAIAAWERVAGSGAALGAQMEAELAQSRGTARAARGDREGAQLRLTEAAQQYAVLGRVGDALRCRAMAAYQAFLARDDDAAKTAYEEAWAQAQAQFDAGRITGTQLVTVRLHGLMRRLERWRRVVDAEPDVDDEISRLISEEGAEDYRRFRELADAHGALPQQAAAARSWAEVTAAIARMFAREGNEDEAAGYVERLLERLGSLVELYTGIYQPWLAAEVELRRGQVFLIAGRPREAEHCARRSSALDSPPSAERLPGPAALLLAEALGAQGDRDDEAAPAARLAAGLLGGADPVGAARARVLMGEAHFRGERHQDAELFYRPALAQLAAHWNDEACRRLIHTAALHYATGLRAVGRPGDAVLMLREVLEPIPEDFAAARSWLLHALAEAAEQDGDGEAALAAYLAAAEATRRASAHQPAVAALESAAELLAPTDLKAALRCVEDAMAHLRAIDDPDAQRYRDFLVAEARTLGLRFLVRRIETESIAQRETDELLPAAQREAEAGVRELWALLEQPNEADSRAEFVAALEAALKSLSLTVAVIRGDPASAARWQYAFAEACERWELPAHAHTARENGDYFAGRARGEGES